MTHRTPAHRNLRLGTAALVTVLLFAGACELTPRSTTPSPTEPSLAEVLGAEEDGMAVEEAAADQSVPVLVLSGDRGAQVTLRRNGQTLRADSIRVSLRSLSTGSADPIVIVDGVRVGSLENVDPDRIISIEILKDAAATERFGPEAVDGVILVTTGEPPVTRVRTPRAAPAVERVEDVEAVGYARTERARAAPVLERVEEVVAIGYATAERTRAVAPAAVEGTAAATAATAERMRAVAPLVEEIVVARDGAAESVRAARAPVAATAMRIRGARTPMAAPAIVEATAPQPLILVDGEEVASLATLDPSNIAEITVLKDASATDLYGARGRHGVILVTLKQ